MRDGIQMCLMTGGGFFFIGCLTWFFSSRRKTMIRTFAAPENLREVCRGIPRDRFFGQGMRWIACLQMGIGAIFALIALAGRLIQ